MAPRRQRRHERDASRRRKRGVGGGGQPWDGGGQDDGEDAVENAVEQRGSRWQPGLCAPHLCGEEAACKPDAARLMHTCICPHDESPPDPKGRCPNRNKVPMAASPIRNIIPPGHGLEAGALPDPPPLLPPHLSAPRDLARDPLIGPVKAGAAPRAAHWTQQLGVGVFGAALIFALCAVAVVWWRYLRRRKSQTPRSLSKGPLGSELFLPNPQYSVGTLRSLGARSDGTLAGAHAHSAPITLIGHHALALQENIGEGCFGKVYRGELRDADGSLQTVAVKVLKESASREAEEDFMREVEVMSTFQHPHILRLVGVLPREPQSPPCMVFEFMPFGDLTEVLRCSSKNPWAPPRPGLPPLTQEALLGVALQVALGMRYLAAQRFVHRDLACRNCLVGQNLTVKIADFGMSRDVYTCDYYKMGGSRALPVRWMSPEALLYGRFTLESDVWSFGVVLWEVFTRGKLPYYGHANDEALKLVLQGVLLQLPECAVADCPAAVVELMRCCWKTEPRDRLRFPEICARLEEALEEAFKGLDLPRPPAFPAAYPALALSLPTLPDELGLGYPELIEADIEDLGLRRGGPGGQQLLDPDNYLLPRAPDPSRVQYLVPIAD